MYFNNRSNKQEWKKMKEERTHIISGYVVVLEGVCVRDTRHTRQGLEKMKHVVYKNKIKTEKIYSLHFSCRPRFCLLCSAWCWRQCLKHDSLRKSLVWSGQFHLGRHTALLQTNFVTISLSSPYSTPICRLTTKWCWWRNPTLCFIVWQNLLCNNRVSIKNKFKSVLFVVIIITKTFSWRRIFHWWWTRQKHVPT